MTLDLVAWGPDGECVIIDHKTGSAPPAAEAGQLLLGALVVSREAEQAGSPLAKVEVEIHQIAEDGTIKRDVAEPSAWDLACFEDELRELLSQPSPELTPGVWCTDDYCPHLLECSVTKADVPQLIPVQDLIRAPQPTARLAAIATIEDLVKFLEIKPKAERILEDLKAQAKAMVDKEGGSILLPDGRRYRTVTMERSGFDKEMAKSLLGDRAAECEKVSLCTQYRVTGTAEGATKKTRKAKSNAAE